MKSLSNFPSVNYVTLHGSVDRQQILESSLIARGIKNITAHKFKKYTEYNFDVRGQYLEQIRPVHVAITIGHLEAIKKWLVETNEPYTLICEDDISFSTSDYWNFEWDEFMEELPSDWDCVILMVIREDGKFEQYTLKERRPFDWGCSAYLITRDFAKKLVETRIKEDHYNFDTFGLGIMPLAENVLYVGIGKVYNVPLLVESGEFNSTYSAEKENQIENTHDMSRDLVVDWWRNVGRFLSAKEICKI